ncbi:helix-turn-helix transcriptional regulator [Desulfuromonas sp. AOP6]|uniref:helix-turn-helix domain-containing protein n=1 Tax=Desulfuromonas sp. AOP6 TaxID=1566351 RepID=UPI0012825EEC|nr:helix-turn-helix transcriptional regulator [Desulfuromonas sp. AOP6]BCA78271.1 hypothetical protein AOP6_0058 [Desulfuromonas sp. AOP6]
MNIFYKFSISPETPHKIEIPFKIQVPRELTEEPTTLGDHLRRRRLELGLYQKDVAVQIGVTTSTIWNWENNWSTITLSCMPKVIEFLGYNPVPWPDKLVDKLAWYKQVHGLTLEQLGAEMNRDPEQLSDWLSGRHKPCRRNRKEVELFLSSHAQGPEAVQRLGAALPEERAVASGSMNSFMARTTSEKL